MRVAVILLCLTMLSETASAEAHEARIPLRDGKLRLDDLSADLLQNLHLKKPRLPNMAIDLRGMRGSLFVMAMNEALGDGCRLSVNDDELVLHVDGEKLPQNVTETKKAARVFTAAAAPEATADQCRYYGLLMPKHVDPSKRMIVLVHGLDSARENWSGFVKLLEAEDYQVAYLTYASDCPLTESAAAITRELRALHEHYPTMPTSVIAYSMGGLVARAYAEGDEYAGGIDHLILIGTPNQGSTWAIYRIALELREHFQLWRDEPTWRPTWMITDGLGEAGSDLKPRSRFLTQLNNGPRRADVHYTIIAGSQHPVRRIGADAVDSLSRIVPKRAAGIWGFRQTKNGLHSLAEKWRSRSGKSDGPVTLASTQLQGVDDHITLQADHESLIYSLDGRPPLAWPIVRERLSH